jgi:hypothetical protein
MPQQRASWRPVDAFGAGGLPKLLSQEWNGDLKLAVNKDSHLNLITNTGEFNLTMKVVYRCRDGLNNHPVVTDLYR